MAFFEELRRRKVFRVGATYVIVGWIIIQVAGLLLPAYGAPAWVMPVFATIIMLGFPLAIVLAWAFEITPDGLRLTVDEDTRRGSPSGLLLNYGIMGVMALVIVWLVFERQLDSSSETVVAVAADLAGLPAGNTEEAGTERLPNSIAVLPFANLSPDASNAFFAAGIHDTVLHELSKISDMNVIARTSVLPYADTTVPLDEIARTLKVETIMEGSVQYAEGQVRITAQLIDPETGSHLWSGNFDKPFADVFAIQSEIAQNIAKAIGAELLPEELQQIARQQTSSEEALALYLQAKGLTPNISPNIDPLARSNLQAAIALDPEFAEPYAVLAFHYALTLGATHPDLSMDEREGLVRQYALTALRLNPDLGLAYGALGLLEGANFRLQTEWEYWEQALALSPNDPDVLDDAIRSFATKGRVDRALELAQRTSDINPDALMTIHEWLAFGTGDFRPFIDSLDELGAQIEQVFSKEFFQVVKAIFEEAQGDHGRAQAAISAVNMANVSPEIFFYVYIPYANGRLGNSAQARQQYDAYVARFGQGKLDTHIDGVFLNLAIGNHEAALAPMRYVLDNAGPDTGIDTVTWGIFSNLFRDPVLDQPEFLALRQQFMDRYGP